MDSTVGIGTAGSLTGPKLMLELDTEGQAGDVIYCITFFTDEEMDFMVSVDGKKVTDKKQ